MPSFSATRAHFHLFVVRFKSLLLLLLLVF
jgi:hypothetical protein